jgi:hypothetical protein
VGGLIGARAANEEIHFQTLSSALPLGSIDIHLVVHIYNTTHASTQRRTFAILCEREP